MTQRAYENWLPAFLAVARHYRLDVSEENVRVTADWAKGMPINDVLSSVAKHLGMELRFAKFAPKMLDPWRLPLVIEFSNGQVGMVEKTDGKGRVSVLLSGDQGLATDLTVDELKERARRVLILRPESSVPDARVDDYIKPYEKNWVWRIILKDWRRYTDVLIASLLANILALAGITFSIQIYDRVVPSQSESTLLVLFGGVLLAICFEFAFRMMRTRITDIIGKRADLTLSDVVFGHAIRLRNDTKPKSVGTFIAQVRELDGMRELLTSTTVTAFVDLPFVLLFFTFLWLIGGYLAFVPMAIIPLIFIPGLLAQKPLAKLSVEGMREASLRSAMLVESIEAMEDIKLLRAEPRFQNQWNQYNAVSADISMRQRYLVSWLMTMMQETQGIVFAAVLFVGAYMVMKGDITTGVLVGTSILSTRTIVPLTQWIGVATRWQQAKVSKQALDELMKRETDQTQNAKLLHRPVLNGDYHIEGVRLRHTEEDKRPALEIARLNIAAGERIALLGRMGAGKSTLLQMLAGLLRPEEGKILLDGSKLEQIDPADTRRDMGYLTQNARLFFGTIRDNLTMGRPLATDQEMLLALKLSGALPLVQREGHGVDYVIREGGYGLSGGQRQALLLARTLILDPRILLLDEPTAVMDELTERQVVQEMLPWLESRTLVVATHRPAVLQWVNRIIVVDKGRILLDGPKDAVLARLSSNTPAAVPAARSTSA